MSSRETTARRVFVALFVLALVLLGLVIRPFAEALFFAAVLTGALLPLQDRLAKALRQRPRTAAAFVCVGVVLALLLPAAGVATVAVREGIEGARYVVRTVQSDGMTGLIDTLPGPLHETFQAALRRFPVEEAELDALLQEQASAQTGKAARAVTGVLAATGAALLQATMMLIALYFLLIDGRALVDWLEEHSPLEPGQMSELLKEFRKVSGSVLVSSLATAGVQALAALVGYLIASVPHPVFFATLTFFTAFIPAVGAGGMALVAAIITWANGHPFYALFLAVWGVAVVGLADNIVKPILVQRGLSMHGGVVFFALVGGFAAFGTVGLLAGPLVVTFFLALVRIHARDYGTA
jgi:predicted PurR-regulated permease PerM